MPNIAIYPGTFDPITLGHIDIIKRACNLFSTVIVAIATNTKKAPLFSLEERIELAKKALAECGDQVQVEGFDKLLVKFAEDKSANIIIRGLRAVSDFDYEFQLAGMNRAINPNIETIFLTPSEQYTYISSTLIREIDSLEGDVSRFASPEVVQALKAKRGKA